MVEGDVCQGSFLTASVAGLYGHPLTTRLEIWTGLELVAQDPANV